MNSFQCLRLSVMVRAEEQILLPSYQGSALRGAFGYALRQSACVVRNQDCDDCLLKAKCVYSYAFETPPPADSEVLRKYSYVPHPFVLNPMTGETGIYEPGMTLQFGMTLVGRAIEYAPYFVYALVRMGEKGLGKGRGRFRLDRISSWDSMGMPVETIYENEKLRPSGPMLCIHHAEELAKKYHPDRITLKFITPIRIKYKQSLCDDLQFHIIVRNLLRRLSNLTYFHCNQRLEIPFAEIIERAKSVSLTENRSKWRDWTRYSGRQKKRMTMGGVIGEVTYKGELAEFLPLLILGSWVNLGKGTSFGLGNYTIKKDRALSITTHNF